MDVLTKQKSNLPQISDVFFVMIHSGKLSSSFSGSLIKLKQIGHSLPGRPTLFNHIWTPTLWSYLQPFV